MASIFNKDNYKSQQKARHDTAMIELATYGTNLCKVHTSTRLSEFKKAVIESADIHVPADIPITVLKGPLMGTGFGRFVQHDLILHPSPHPQE